MTDEELKKLCDAATPGPWRWGMHGGDFLLGADNHVVMSAEEINVSVGDAQFIVAAREMVPKLIKVVNAAKRAASMIGEPTHAHTCGCYACELWKSLDELEQP